MTFDWIVARLGGCFPYKIIMQILQCGIKRFVDDYRCHLDSEAGILDYMTSCHEQHLRAAFREMLREGFAPKKPLDVAVVPFLLITTNYSDTILQSLVNVLVEICKYWLNKEIYYFSNTMSCRYRGHVRGDSAEGAVVAEQQNVCRYAAHAE